MSSLIECCPGRVADVEGMDGDQARVEVRDARALRCSFTPSPASARARGEHDK